MGSPKNRLDPGHQLPWAKRLGDVIVRAQLQANDPVGFLSLGGEHDDGKVLRLRICPKLSAYFQSVHLRQHEIQDDQIRRLPASPFQRLFAILGHAHLVSLPLQVVRDHPDDVLLILHHQDLGRDQCAHLVGTTKFPLASK